MTSQILPNTFLELKKMFLLQQFRHFFASVSLSIMFATVIAFGLGTEAAWTAIPLTEIINQPQVQISTMKQADTINNAKGQVKEMIGNMTGNAKKQSDGKAMQFKAKTLEGLNNSIEAPNYKSSGENNQTEDQAHESTKDVEAQVRETFK